MDYKNIVSKIISNEENTDLLKLIISLYKSYFNNIALDFVNNTKKEGFNNQDFNVLKEKIRERFPNEDWNNVKDVDLFHYVVITINRLDMFRA